MKEKVIRYFKNLALKYFVPPKFELKRANLVNHKVLHIHYKDLRTNTERGLLRIGEYQELYKIYRSENLPEDILNTDILTHDIRFFQRKHKEGLIYEK